MTRELLEKLCELLEEERAAVARLDFSSIERIANEKAALLPAEAGETAPELAPLVEKLRRLASAQVALYRDAVSTMAQVLIGPTPAPTYDGRARIRRVSSLSKGRAL